MSDPMYYYSRDRQTREGPVSFAELQDLARRRVVRPDHLVWTDGMGEWVAAERVPGLVEGGPPPIPTVPPVVPGEVRTHPDAREPVYAGFWLRFVAVIIDGLVLMIPNWVVNAVVATALGVGMLNPTGGQNLGPVFAYLGLSIVISMTMQWLYFAMMESSAHQATLGKMAMGIRVTSLRGERIGFAQASGRYFAKILSGLILNIGYIMAAFTERKQALHDIMAECLVVRV